MKVISAYVLMTILIIFALLSCTDKKLVYEQTVYMIDVGSEVDYLNYINIENSDDNSISVDDSNLDINKLGNYFVSYKMNNSKNNGERITINVDVVDRKPPSLISSVIEIERYSDADILCLLDVQDNYQEVIKDIDLLNLDEIDVDQLGVYHLKLKLTDDSGNTSEVQCEINVVLEEPSDDQRLALRAIAYLFEMVDPKFDIEIKEVVVNSERYFKYISIKYSVLKDNNVRSVYYEGFTTSDNSLKWSKKYKLGLERIEMNEHYEGKRLFVYRLERYFDQLEKYIE